MQYGTHPNTPTVQTNVLSPLFLSTLILSSTLPLTTSHFLRLLSEHPATNHESDQSFVTSSSSSESSMFLVLGLFEEVSRGTGGAHARLRIRLLTRSKRRRWVRESSSSERRWIEPSSQPRARTVDAGFGAMDQMEPPWEGIVL